MRIKHELRLSAPGREAFDPMQAHHNPYGSLWELRQDIDFIQLLRSSKDGLEQSIEKHAEWAYLCVQFGRLTSQCF